MKISPEHTWNEVQYIVTVESPNTEQYECIVSSTLENAVDLVDFFNDDNSERRITLTKAIPMAAWAKGKRTT